MIVIFYLWSMTYFCIQSEFNQVTYSMITDATAASLFRLEPTSGRITLVSSLTADDAPRYLVCCVFRFYLLNLLSKLSSNSMFEIKKKIIDHLIFSNVETSYLDNWLQINESICLLIFSWQSQQQTMVVCQTQEQWLWVWTAIWMTLSGSLQEDLIAPQSMWPKIDQS